MTGPLRYDQFVEDALRGVVRRTLETVAQIGLPGNHHLYITFDTRHPGVDIPSSLSAQYPDEMTIVLQHQFWGLDIREDQFAVTLSFNKLQERLLVPFAAVTAFADPAVNFGLQFKSGEASATDIKSGSGRGDTPPIIAKLASVDQADAVDTELPESKATGNDDNVVTLDTFRKK